MIDKFEEQLKLSVLMPEIARKIDAMIKEAGLPPQPWSFYTWGGHRCQYISNTDRRKTKVAMQETLDRWDEVQDPPVHKFNS